MQSIRKIFTLNRYYFLGYLFFFLVCLSFLLFTSKAASFLYLGSYHSKILDDFFIGYTNLGDGLFAIFIILLLLVFRRFEIAWQILAAFLISGLIAQVLKYLVYSPRPKEFFSQNEHIYLIDGITHTGTSSFPSGHTVSIFALTTILSLFTKNKKICWLYLLPAILVAYSRIYLSQHFLTDVLAGSLVGVSVAVFVYWFFKTKINKKWISKDQEMIGIR